MKRKLACVDRDKECRHGTDIFLEGFFTYTGSMPCTGDKVCPLCGMKYEDWKRGESK